MNEENAFISTSAVFTSSGRHKTAKVSASEICAATQPLETFNARIFVGSKSKAPLAVTNRRAFRFGSPATIEFDDQKACLPSTSRGETRESTVKYSSPAFSVITRSMRPPDGQTVYRSGAS